MYHDSMIVNDDDSFAALPLSVTDPIEIELIIEDDSDSPGNEMSLEE